MNQVTEQDMKDMIRHLTRTPFDEVLMLWTYRRIELVFNKVFKQEVLDSSSALLEEHGWTEEEFYAAMKRESPDLSPNFMISSLGTQSIQT